MRYGALVCLLSAALAAPAGAADAPAPASGAPAVPTTAGLDDAAAARLTEAIAQRQQLVAGAQAVAKAVDEARHEKDIVKLNYLSGIEKSVGGLVRVADQALHNLQQALLRHDVAAANHEQEKLTIVADKVKVLATQSQTAVGGLAVYSGDTQVDFTVDEAVTGSNIVDPVARVLTEWSIPPLVVERPPAASPYQ